jgi:hypothetical protein
MYANIGQGAHEDYLAAYMWSSVAAAQGNEDAQRLVKLLAAKLAPDQIAEARRSFGDYNKLDCAKLGSAACWNCPVFSAVL